MSTVRPSERTIVYVDDLIEACHACGRFGAGVEVDGNEHARIRGHAVICDACLVAAVVRRPQVARAALHWERSANTIEDLRERLRVTLDREDRDALTDAINVLRRKAAEVGI